MNDSLTTARDPAIAVVLPAEHPPEVSFGGEPGPGPARSEGGPVPTWELDLEAAGRLPPFPGVRHPVQSLLWLLRGLFGLASLIVLLAVIAAIPVVNFLALGYLLEAEGRVGRSGRLRDGFPLLGLGPRLGMIALGTYLWLLPVRLVATSADAAHIIAPGSPADQRMQTLRGVVGGVVAVCLALALARGGSLGSFLLPVRNIPWLLREWRSGTYLETAGRQVRSFVAGLRLKHHFLLGVRGFFAALAWLAIPTLVYASIQNPGGAGAVQLLLGIGLLVLAFAWTPFLQARLAVENRWGAGFELREVRELFCSAPLAWLLAVVVTYVLALPLYLFKAFSPPRDALWPITLIFMATIYPARLITGWAYHRGLMRRTQGKRSWWITRMAVRVGVMLPLLSLYAFLLYFTQFLGAHGRATLFEHHAFLLPWPYLLGVD